MKKIEIYIDSNWKDILNIEFQKKYFKDLINLLKSERKIFTIFPKEQDIFNAFHLCPFNKLKVVIIGQDPYHKKGQAHGLSFSVPSNIKSPPSLKNIIKEVNNDLSIASSNHGDLSCWAKQGVLMLNTALTVRANEAGSHTKIGWENFTNQIIRHISKKKENIIFLLWGKFAQQKSTLINKKRHYILKAAHPSPFSAYSGFFGCKHFSKTNKILMDHNLSPINWNV